MTKDESRLRLADYLAHMSEATRLAREHVAGVAKEDFVKDRRTQQAVVLGMHNRMAHGYFDIDLNIVWDTVQSSLLRLDSQRQTLLSRVTT